MLRGQALERLLPVLDETTLFFSQESKNSASDDP